MSGIAVILLAAIASTSALGKAGGLCRGDGAPEILVEARGLKDRAGLLRVEIYPDNDADFLADDNMLIASGKTFARVDMPIQATGPAIVCIRAPKRGRYTLSMLHDRDANLHFGPSKDGIGFPGDPRLGWSKPRAAQAGLTVEQGTTRISIRLNYRHGLLMRPLEDK